MSIWTFHSSYYPYFILLVFFHDFFLIYSLFLPVLSYFFLIFPAQLFTSPNMERNYKKQPQFYLFYALSHQLFSFPPNSSLFLLFLPYLPRVPLRINPTGKGITKTTPIFIFFYSPSLFFLRFDSTIRFLLFLLCSDSCLHTGANREGGGSVVWLGIGVDESGGHWSVLVYYVEAVEGGGGGGGWWGVDI